RWPRDWSSDVCSSDLTGKRGNAHFAWGDEGALIRDMPAGHGISYGRTFITPSKMRVATLSCGYADGYPRHLSNRGISVLVRGQRSEERRVGNVSRSRC